MRLAQAICGLQSDTLQARQAKYVSFLAADGSTIDRGLVLWFAAPHSYTGEEVLELQGHGGPVVLHMLLNRCLEAGLDMGLRLAQPGEFTPGLLDRDRGINAVELVEVDHVHSQSSQ